VRVSDRALLSPVVCTAAVLLWLLCACPGGPGGGGGPPERGTGKGIAKVSITGGKMEIRMAGETAFEPWNGKGEVTPGTTIRSSNGVVYLNIMGCVQAQMGGTSGQSVLIFEGPVRENNRDLFVLGLKQGELRINSSADRQVVVKMPHGEVRGDSGAYFHIDIEQDKDGLCTAVLKALSRNNITVKNGYGSLLAPYWANIRIDESKAPVVLKEDRRRGM